MNTIDKAEDIIERLHDAACGGDVAEVLVVYRDSDGALHFGCASDDILGLFDSTSQALARFEANIAEPVGRLN